MPLHYYRSLISDTFRILDFMNYTFPPGHNTYSTHEISYRFERTDCISEVSKYVDWIEVNGNREDLVRILPIGQRRVAIPTNEKSYGLETYELLIQKMHELSTQSRLSVAQTIPSWFQRPTGLETRQWPSQSKSIATNSYKNSKATNCSINEIRYVTFQLSQLTITGTIP
jgi:hypothetical protein